MIGSSPDEKAQIKYEPATTTSARLKKIVTDPGEIPAYLKLQLEGGYEAIKLRWLWRQSDNGIITRQVQGSTLQLDLTDPGLSTDLAVYGIREPAMTRYYQNALSQIATDVEEPVVVDIGANIGYYAFMPLTVDPCYEVLAIEAEQDNYEQLVQNAELNEYDGRLTTIHAAVGDTHDTAKLNVSSHSNRHTIHDIDSNIYERSECVEIKPLPSVCSQAGYDFSEIDVIRMDVEGYEAKVFRGINTLQREQPRWINIEIHPNLMDDEDVDYLIDQFTSIGVEIIAATWKGHDLDVNAWCEIKKYRWLTVLCQVPPA